MTRIVALHGFLGQAADWQGVREELAQQAPQCDFQAVSLYSPPLVKAKSLKDWSKRFNLLQKPKHVERNILIGYSLGGRLALHASADKPGLWDDIVLISAHPGLTDFEDIQSRMLADEEWAEKFSHLPWEEVLRQWNEQPVFSGSLEPVRHESDYDRQQLIHMIKDWSLAQHDILDLALANIKPKLKWYAGENDAKYAPLFKSLKERGFIEGVHLVRDASHRIIFDNPKEFTRQLVNDLNL